jgi:bloom syndrome protein
MLYVGIFSLWLTQFILCLNLLALMYSDFVVLTLYFLILLYFFICDVVQWGHDFRPDYLNLSQIRTKFPSVPLMALTATANKSVVNDCMRLLQMRDPYLHTQSFNRANLRYAIRKKESDKKVVQEIGDFVLKHRRQSGIIYCLSKKDTQNMAEALQKVIPSMKREITFYHAELTPHEKEHRQRNWSKGDIKLICATIAFGMGINKPDGKWCVYY